MLRILKITCIFLNFFLFTGESFYALIVDYSEDQRRTAETTAERGILEVPFVFCAPLFCLILRTAVTTAERRILHGEEEEEEEDFSYSMILTTSVYGCVCMSERMYIRICCGNAFFHQTTNAAGKASRTTGQLSGSLIRRKSAGV